jgi:hypothetical protein
MRGQTRFAPEGRKRGSKKRGSRMGAKRNGSKDRKIHTEREKEEYKKK